MSAYLPPNHNRLLDLEHHIRGSQFRVRPSRQRPSRQPARMRTTRESLQTPPRGQRQQAPQTLGYKPLSQLLDEPPALCQPGLKQQQPQYNPELVAPSPAQQTPRPQRTKQPSGPYQQLAAKLGKHSHVTPQTRTLSSDLPNISTPINPEMVETFSVAPIPETITKKQRRALTSPLESSPAPRSAERQSKPAPSAHHSVKPPKPQPTSLTSYKILANTIRQARLGISTATADVAQQHSVEDVSKLEDISHDSASDSSLKSLPVIEPVHEQDAQPCDPSLEIQSIDVFADVQDQAVGETAPPEEDLYEDIPASAVTIDVEPVVPAEDTVSDATPPSPTLPADPEISPPVHDESPKASAPGSDTAGLRNSMLLLTYQLACPPQLVAYMAQLQHKRHKRKHHKRKRSSADKKSPPHPNVF